MDRGRNQLPDSSGRRQRDVDFRGRHQAHRADRVEFSSDGRFLAWSNSDGTIDVADLDVIRRGDEIGRQEK